MPEYLAPGVYVEEVRTGPRPIEGVATSTAGFAGETERGSTRPRLVTSWQDFTSHYGGYIDRTPFNRSNHFLPYAVRGFFDNGGQRVFVARVIGASSVAAAISLDGNPGPTTLRAAGKGDWGNNILIAVTAAAASSPGDPPLVPLFRIQVAYYADGIRHPFVDPTDPSELANPDRRTPDVFEEFDSLSADPTLPNFAKTVLNSASRLVEVLDCPGPPAAVSFPSARLNGGIYVQALRADYAGAASKDPEARTGLAGLAAIREIALMAVPDEVVINDLTSELTGICDTLKDRFAIVSEPRPHAAVTLIHPVRDTSYGAMYYPWVRVAAPHTPTGTTLVPAAGHIAGIYARVDAERGVHKAPANEVVQGIVIGNPTAGPLSHTVTRAEQEILNPRGVNVIRDFGGQRGAAHVWGARTMSSDPEWRYVNVRRLLVSIEQSIGRGTRWVVFEPNADPTWSAVRTAINDFLRSLWRSGALMGRTQDEAFFVKCDRTTMTQDDIDEGRLICEVGVAPVRPAEFVILRFGQRTCVTA